MASAIGVQGWILREIIEIKTKIAVLTVTQENMKKTNSLAIIAVLFALIPLLFAGCHTSGGLLKREEIVTAETNIVAEPFVSYRAGWDTLEGASNAVAITLTNFVEKIVYKTNEVFTPAPAVVASVETVRAFTPFIPAPFNTAAELALATGLGVLGWYARRKTARARNDLDAAYEENQKLAAIAGSLITGIEKAVRKDSGSSVKVEVKNEAEASGVLQPLHDLVKRLT